MYCVGIVALSVYESALSSKDVGADCSIYLLMLGDVGSFRARYPSLSILSSIFLTTMTLRLSSYLSPSILCITRVSRSLSFLSLIASSIHLSTISVFRLSHFLPLYLTLY